VYTLSITSNENALKTVLPASERWLIGVWRKIVALWRRLSALKTLIIAIKT
jgi:hypothetical protein